MSEGEEVGINIEWGEGWGERQKRGLIGNYLCFGGSMGFEGIWMK